MESAGKNDPIGLIEAELRRSGVPFVRELFRVPARPEISPCAGFLISAAGAFLMASGSPYSSFFAGVAGVLLLVLYNCGFSPLDWLGTKEKRSALVVPGTVAGENGKATFIAAPLFCRLTPSGLFSRQAAILRRSNAAGLVLSLALPLAAGAASLRYVPVLRMPAIVAGAALALLAAAQWARGKPGAPRRNLAALWAARPLPASASCERPFMLFYPGGEAEVKFFLAKYRRHVLRGRGIFVEFSEGSSGPPAVTVGEGSFLLPCRVDPALFSTVRAAGDKFGVHAALTARLLFPSAGLVAMSRGFSAVTLFRTESPAGDAPSLPDAHAAAWLEGILRAPL
jgi:hypothetical protein